jgi:arylsulfatase A-like enzyme
MDVLCSRSGFSRRRFLAASSAAAASTTLRARPSERPNILLLLTDDQRWDTLGSMGNGVIRTPNLDRLAGQGVLFRNNFCATAICCTSRASIYTGLYEKSHGVSDFSTNLPAALEAHTYPALLRAAGYRTGLVGKYGVGDRAPAGVFDFWRGPAGQNGGYMVEHHGRRMHATRVVEEEAMEFLRAPAAGRPFCLSVNFQAPHAEDDNPAQYVYDPALRHLYKDATIPVPKTATAAHFDALPDFLRTSEARARWGQRFHTVESYQEMVKSYYRLVSGVDDAVGSIVAALERQGLADNTVIVFSSDNGCYLGEHGLADKWFMHEEAIRTPLVICDPRLPAYQRGAVREEMSLNIDLAPTLLKLAGINPPDSMQGRDLGPLLRGDRKTRWRKDWFYSHHFRHPKIPRSEGVRTERFAYMWYLDSEPVYEELYDLRTDPLEERNLAGEEGRSAEFRRRWTQWSQALARWRPDAEWKDPA